MTTIARRVLLVILSCGWLLPLSLAYDSLLSYIAYQAIPEVQGKTPLASFAFREWSGQMAKAAAIWLAVAISYWVIANTSRAVGQRAPSAPAA